MKKLILDTPKVKVYQEKEGIVVYMKLENSTQWMRNMPHKADLTGLIGALTLGIDALAGKVWPGSVVSLEGSDYKSPKDNGPKLLVQADDSFLAGLKGS